MQRNMAACDSVLKKIDSKELALYAGKALSCADGPFTKPQNTMADAGERIFAIYIFDTANRRYKKVILNVTGDWSQQNLAANTKEVVDWMTGIK